MVVGEAVSLQPAILERNGFAQDGPQALDHRPGDLLGEIVRVQNLAALVHLRQVIDGEGVVGFVEGHLGGGGRVAAFLGGAGDTDAGRS